MKSTLQTYAAALYRMYCQFEERVVAPESTDPLTRISVTEAAKQIREGKLASYQLVKAYLDRIKHVNLYVNAVTETFDVEALEEAQQVDEYLRKLDKESDEYRNLAEAKPLLGVPVSIKCAFQVRGHRNISGLCHRRDLPLATEDAPVVARIREAGGIPHCYTNVPAACFWIESTNKINGTSASPYDTRTTCGGSSGGEGSIISAEGSLVGIGSDFGGSVRQPAMLNGIFGLKPVNTIPFDGHCPQCPDDEDLRLISGTGPFTRYAEDMALFYSVLSHIPIPGNYLDLKLSKVLTATPTGNALQISDDIRNALSTVAGFLADHFSANVEEFEFEPLEKLLKWYLNIGANEGDNSMIQIGFPNSTMSDMLQNKIKSYLGLSKVNAGSAELLDWFSAANPPAEKKRLHQELLNYRAKINNFLKNDAVIVVPAYPKTHYFHGEQLITQNELYTTCIFNGLALSVATAPIGLDNGGYPISVQIVAARGNDYLLIRLQEILEKKFGGWRPAGSK
ncbi:unnamed protein product [Bursaphelenchus xylophilus]|uniref:(pine wood nematode) hypothetical protein n=1 Tax=Bursaphelenchus xylophilus TaxID=6326 RepID=A0A1I7SKZ9_BURXY|nr:unnamed protein product [Bursaphelenchus xylophilus]CAG9129314.1 unnamed protein product [Bursaphelenchus xylophilus]